MPTLNRHLAAAENLTSAFPESGRSDAGNLRFLPTNGWLAAKVRKFLTAA